MNVSAFSQSSKWKIEASIEQLNHNFNWSIAGNMAGHSPNVLSELIWKDLKGPKLNLEVSRQINPYLEVTFGFNKHIIKKGSGSDTDYQEDNRQDAYFYQQFISNKGNAENYLFVVKYILQPKIPIKIKPYLGINFFDQKLYILDPIGPLATLPLNSTYSSKWDGVVFGLEAIYQINKITFTVNALTGYYNYEAKAQWNLIKEFNQPLSFKQNADGYKFSVNLKSDFAITKNCAFLLALEKQYGATFSGIDEAYLSNGSIPKTKFNGAVLRSLGLKTGIIFTF